MRKNRVWSVEICKRIYKKERKFDFMAEKTVKLEDPANNRMGSAKMLPLILTMALPAMFSMLIQALYNIVDSYFVAQVSQNALTAVSLAFPIQNLLVAFGVGTGVGVSSLISRRLGERDQEAADNAATHGIILSAITYVVLWRVRLRRFTRRTRKCSAWARRTSRL
jgi:Na+-driven multidrug efflux pump